MQIFDRKFPCGCVCLIVFSHLKQFSREKSFKIDKIQLIIVISLKNARTERKIIILTLLFQISMSSLVARLLPQARLLQKTPVGISSAVIQKNDIHTSSSSLGSLQMPERLQHIPDAEVN